MIILETFIFTISSIILIFSFNGLGSIININRSKFFLFENIFLGIILSSLCSTFIHLFYSINFWFSLIIFLTGLLISIKKKLFKMKIITKKNIQFFIIFLLFTPLFITQKYHEDFGYYHLPHIINFISEKIIFGLSNVNTAHALSSISDYISASFWLDGNYILLHYVNLIFIGLFYFVMYKYLFGDNNYFKFSAFGVLIFSFLDNFGVNSGRNGFFAIQGIGKPDIIFGVSFFFCCIYIHCFLRKKISNSEILFTYILTIFSFQLKQFGIVSVLH